MTYPQRCVWLERLDCATHKHWQGQLNLSSGVRRIGDQVLTHVELIIHVVSSHRYYRGQHPPTANDMGSDHHKTTVSSHHGACLAAVALEAVYHTFQHSVDVTRTKDCLYHAGSSQVAIETR